LTPSKAPGIPELPAVTLMELAASQCVKAGDAKASCLSGRNDRREVTEKSFRRKKSDFAEPSNAWAVHAHRQAEFGVIR